MIKKYNDDDDDDDDDGGDDEDDDDDDEHLQHKGCHSPPSPSYHSTQEQTYSDPDKATSASPCRHVYEDYT